MAPSMALEAMPAMAPLLTILLILLPAYLLYRLYGKHTKPTVEDLKGINLVIFDVQDVGARFYTYISTLHYVMEACAENNIELMILDRPNPNGVYVDGPFWILPTALL
jgi:uncharacterized protein YbbC (DUF1343 family)